MLESLGTENNPRSSNDRIRQVLGANIIWLDQSSVSESICNVVYNALFMPGYFLITAAHQQITIFIRGA